MSEFDTRLVTEADKAEWRGLFDGYADFYKVVMTDTIADTVWSWLHDPNHGLEGLIARDGQGTAVGIAHIRSCPAHSLAAKSVFSTTCLSALTPVAAAPPMPSSPPFSTMPSPADGPPSAG